jgi:hypothetical protein
MNYSGVCLEGVRTTTEKPIRTAGVRAEARIHTDKIRKLGENSFYYYS